MQISRMTAEDIPATAEVYLSQMRYGVTVPDAYRNNAAVLPDAGEMARDFRRYLEEQLANPDWAVMIARQGEAAVGLAEGCLARPVLPAWLVTDLRVGYLALAHVLPSHRRQGIGRALEAALVAFFRERGAGFAELGYFTANHLGAATWPALGYRTYYEDLRREIGATAPAQGNPPAEPDLPALAGLYASLASHTLRLADPYLAGARSQPPEWFQEALAGHLRNPLAHIAVARQGGEVVGFMIGELQRCPVPPWLAAVKQVGSVVDAWVAPPAGRGHTLARLEGELAGFFAAHGVTMVQARVLAADEDAREDWAALGYRTFSQGARKGILANLGTLHADQEYLRSKQYQDAGNLNARIGLHRRFGTNRYGWHRWVFDQLQLPPQARILEVGCGPGTLWPENRDRIPPGWEVALSDFSPGMLGQAERNLRRLGHRFTFAVADAQAIPFPDGDFDAVIANHMLYHLPDRPRALAELRRVLRPGGCLYAATNGQAHLQELWTLIDRLVPGTSAVEGQFGFTLEGGAEQLAPWFAPVELRRFANGLAITEAEPLVAYVLSGHDIRPEQAGAFSRLVEEELAARGVIRITLDPGLFVAARRDVV